jgi:hypothetical protein
MAEDPQRDPDAADEPLAALVAGLLLIPVVLFVLLTRALDGTSIVVKIAFCIVVPSLVGSGVAGLVRAGRR